MPPQSKSLPSCSVTVSLAMSCPEWAGFGDVGRQAARSPDAAETPNCLVCFSVSTDLGANFYFCSITGGGEVELDRPGLLMCPTQLPPRESLTPAE